MRTTGVGQGLLALLLGLAMLTVAGCFGGNRNFSPEGSAAAQPVQGSGAQAAGATRPDVGLRVGNLAPDFGLKGLDGKEVRLSELRGKPVLVNFWATWCPPCREEMPDLEKAYQKYRGEGITFLGVDREEDAETVRKFVQKGGYNWTFLLDSDGQVNKLYQVSAIPTTFFIDRDGVIRDTHIGAISPALLEAKLNKIRLGSF